MEEKRKELMRLHRSIMQKGTSISLGEITNESVDIVRCSICKHSGENPYPPLPPAELVQIFEISILTFFRTPQWERMPLNQHLFQAFISIRKTS
jgi:hypothetical protein